MKILLCRACKETGREEVILLTSTTLLHVGSDRSRCREIRPLYRIECRGGARLMAGGHDADMLCMTMHEKWSSSPNGAIGLWNEINEVKA